MKTILKSLLVWLLLLAVPFQGFASATMLVCAPLSSAPVAVTKTALSLGDARSAATEESEHCAAMANGRGDDAGTEKSSHHANSKCNSCASCHVGAALASSDASRITLETQQFSSIPFDLGFVAVVDLDFPERPPQAQRT